MPPSSRRELRPDRLQSAAPGAPVELWIYSAYPKDGWSPRKPGDLIRSDHPGTAVQMGSEIFEIVTCEEVTEPGYCLRYGLKKWDSQHVIRRVVPYSPQSEAQAAADYAEEERRRKMERAIRWLFPLAGLAPDPLQQQWEKKTGLNMTAISAGSALLIGLFCLSVLQITGHSAGWITPRYVVLILGAESFLRFMKILFSGKPRGTIFLTVPYQIWDALAHPGKWRRRREFQLKSTWEHDEVIRQEQSGRLMIRSTLLDDLLAGGNPVLFEGQVYRPVRWRQEGTGLGRRFVYELVHDEAKVAARVFSLPRAPERQLVSQALTRKWERVQIFALLWGTYPRDQQLRLAEKYHFAAAKWTGNTAAFLLVCAILQISAALVAYTTPYFMIGPTYLLFESVYRLYRSKVHGLPAASLAGYMLGLLFRPPD